MEWKDIFVWVSIAVNLGSAAMGAFAMLRHQKMFRELFAEQASFAAEQEAFNDAQAAWWAEQAKWLDNRKARIMARYSRREAQRYLAELNRLEEIAKPMSSKICSSMKSDENVG